MQKEGITFSMTVRSRAKNLADAALRPIGLRLDRIEPAAEREQFYPTVSSCQIPTLSQLFERFFDKRTAGIFVEIGAFDGLTYSNTWGLAERGWERLLIEPIPELAAKFRDNHRFHSRVSIAETAIGDSHGVASMVLGGPLSTANHAQAGEYRTTAWARPLVTEASIEVPMTTLDSLLDDRNFSANFDLLVVDVEGYESAVFAGFSLNRWLPKMLIVELADTHPDLSLMASSDAQLSSEIQATGYRIVYKDAINTVFVHKELFSSTYSRTLNGSTASFSRSSDNTQEG
jgi:FkbM family methyltransferase